MFCRLTFVRVNLIKVILHISNPDSLHSYLDLRRREIMRMSLDTFQNILGHLVHDIASSGKLQTKNALHVLRGSGQGLGLFEPRLRSTEVHLVEAEMFEAANIPRDLRVDGLDMNRPLPLDMDWVLQIQDGKN